MRKKSDRLPTIALFGYYGAGNLGDEAVVSTLIRNIRARMPGVRLLGISLNPADTRARHGIDALPIRRMYVPKVSGARAHTLFGSFLRILAGVLCKVPAEAAFTVSSMIALGSIDAVIVAGSGGVYDWWHGAWTHPFTHFRWALLCRLRGTRLLYMNVGAGPFKTRLGKWFFRYALKSASYRSFRDEESLFWMNHIGMHKSAFIYPDMAFDFITQPTEARAGWPDHARRTRARRVGINALPFYHAEWSALLSEKGGIGYEAYIGALADFVDWIIERGGVPVFFHSQIGDGFLDADIAHAVDTKRRETLWRQQARFVGASTQQELMAEISELDIVVASRYHAVLFSYLLGKPVLGISYHPKIDDLMRCMDQSAYMLDICTLSFERLAAAYTQLEESVFHGAWSLESGIVARRRSELGSQFDDVFLHNASHLLYKK